MAAFADIVLPTPAIGVVYWRWFSLVAWGALTVDNPVAPWVLLCCRSAMLIRWRLHNVQVNNDPEGEATMSTWGNGAIVYPSRVACDCQPGEFGNVGGVVRPSPKTQHPGVITPKGLLLDVVEVAGFGHRSLGDAFVPGVGWDAFQTEADMVTEVAVVAVAECAPWLDADSEVTNGEPSQGHGHFSVVRVPKVDEEVFRAMAHHLDIVKKHPKTGTDAPLDDLRLDAVLIPVEACNRRT